jgi:hypothetical protein
VRSISAVSGSAKGPIFETVVKKLLQKNEYEPCTADNEQVDDKGRVRGRGEWHQIDALGRWKYTVPFVYPIRLLCEAKCWGKPVGLPVVRNFVGVVKDIAENYFVEDNQDIDRRMFSKRHTDCGAIFSVSGFTRAAQRYAYAQGIFPISYENNPIIDEFRKHIDEVCRFVRLGRRESRRRFSEWFEETWSAHYPPDTHRYVTDRIGFESNLRMLKDRVAHVKTSVVGIASGVYPLHLLSYQELPYDSFRETDEALFRTTYRRTERGGHYFEVYPSNLPNVRFYFTVPEVILTKYTDSMKRFKMEFLEWIDIPITVREMRRILRFKLDREWLSSVDEHSPRRTEHTRLDSFPV